jgi:hypothetical protein
MLGSYLTDAYRGDIRCRNEVAERLAHDVRQGVHARKVMESYQTWFGEGPEPTEDQLFIPHAGRALLNNHARIGSSGGAILLRAC